MTEPRGARVFRSAEEARSERRHTAIALGVFDGVHRGHQAVLRMTAAWAAGRGWRAMALTFDPHPAQVLGRVTEPFLLTTVDERIRRMAACGIDAVLVLPFDERTRMTSAEDFVRHVVVEAVGARGIVCGADFRFGHDRRGDVALLRDLGAAYDYEVRVCAPVFDAGAPISSTRIRAAVHEGRHEEARRLLETPSRGL